MDPPPVQYVTTSDGYNIAYAVSGRGRTFVILPGSFEHVQLAWQYPKLQPWLEGLAERFQLIQLDERGCGMSTRGLKDDHSREHYQRDIEAVVDHLNPDPFVLYAGATRTSTAVQFTLNHPDRVFALILGTARLSQASSATQSAFFNTLPEADWQVFLRSLASQYQAPEDVPRSVALLNQAFEQEDFAQRMRVALLGLPEEPLSRLRTPTLILYPRDYWGGEETSSMRAAQMARATFTLINGSFSMGDAEQGIRAIEAFLADLAKKAPEAGLSPQTTLSARQLEVLRLLAAGQKQPGDPEGAVHHPQHRPRPRRQHPDKDQLQQPHGGRHLRPQPRARVAHNCAMDAPPVQYVTTSDGYSIAYAVSGSGEPLAFLPLSYSHLQLNWSHRFFVPSRRPILEALARRFSVVQFDNRGQGMSSRGLRGDFAMEDYLRDLETVLDRLALERAIILGAGTSSHNAIHYALVHPERVKALVLISAPMSMSPFAGFMKDLPTQNWEYFLHSQLAPGLSPEEVGRGIELIKQTTNREDFLKTAEVWTRSEIGDSLPRLRTPTLVMHPRDFLLVPPDDSMQLAAKITNAQMVMIGGASIYGDAQQAVQAVEDFLAGLIPDENRAVSQGPGGTDVLSPRELEVLHLLAAGRSNQQIADELVISLNTVRRHVSNVFDKTGVANRTEASVYARDHGLA